MKELRKSLKGWVWATDDGGCVIAMHALEDEPGVHCALVSVRQPIIFAPLFAGLPGLFFFLKASIRIRLSRNPNPAARLRGFLFCLWTLSIISIPRSRFRKRQFRVT